jgi:hypothetical protein
MQIVQIHSSATGASKVFTAEFGTSVAGGAVPQVESPSRIRFFLEYFSSEREQVFEKRSYFFYDGSIVMEVLDSGKLSLRGNATNASV